jgi:hypothetical protein
MGQTPFDERELTVLISGLLLALSSIYFRAELRRVPEWRLLLAGIGCMIVGGVATLVEHVVAYDLFNHLEHLSYMMQSLVLAFWALRVRKVAL